MGRFAAFTAQLSSSTLPYLFALSGAAYLALILLPQGGAIAELCGTLTVSDLGRLLLTAPWLVSPGQLAFDWGVMVVAMMTPLIAPLLSHARRSVTAERRWAATIAFLGAYWAVWWASFLMIFPLAIALTTVTGDDAGFPAALLIAMIYSASPAAQRARNACHVRLRIGAHVFQDSARQGFFTGLRCIAACWPWMLVPLTVVTGHTALMAVIAFYLFADRITPPAQPGWQIPPAFETLFGPTAWRAGSFGAKTAR